MFKPLTSYLFIAVFVFWSSQVVSQTQDSATEQQQAEKYLDLLQKAYHEGDYNLHKQYSDSLFVHAKEHGLTVLQIKALVNQAINGNIQGDYQKTIALYHEALDVCRTIPDDVHNQTLVLVNLANTYTNVDLHDKAIATMEQVLQQADRTDKPDLMRVAALNGLSKSHSYLGNEEEALMYAKKVKELGDKMKNEDIVLTGINHISNSHYNLGDYEKAVQVAQEAFAYEAFNKPTKTKAWILVNLGTAHAKLKDFANAETYLNQSLQIAIDQSIAEIKIVCYQNLVDVYKNTGNTEAMIKTERLFADAKINAMDNERAAVENDLKAEINDQQKTISEQEKAVALLNDNQKRMVMIGLLLAVLLGIVSWVFIKRKGSFKLETGNLEKTSASLGEEPSKAYIPPQEKYRNSSLSENDRVRYKEKILELIEREKPYLDNNLTLGDFAKIADISSHHLSEVLHFEFEQNFYGFINYYRTTHAQALLEDPKNSDAKMLAIAFESGFQSKTTFYRVFKNQMGITPLEYRKRYQS